ncbi:MAG: plasmid pRiA4b ORF-3 family protein [Bacteroidales bacterium]|nr:plasmid pRiA4b ORF-3 family protein [Bacteroidales bacterium]
MIYQIKISLNGSNPAIWRRLLIPSDNFLKDFHNIIQIAMGWEDAHLHQFVKEGIFYGIKYPDDDWWEDEINVDYKKKKLRVADLLKVEKEKIIYEYDFGDSWMHEILLEKILPADKDFKHPVCTGGKMNCPPEDCGGVWGYAEMLEILKQPDHEEYENYLEWLGTDFDPGYFDMDEINRTLNKIILQPSPHTPSSPKGRRGV